MYITDRNSCERARLSDFSDEILSEESTKAALSWLLPLAVIMVLLLLVSSLMGGIKLSSLLVVLAFSLAFLGTRHS